MPSPGGDVAIHPLAVLLHDGEFDFTSHLVST
jgi:hypothetical protein